MRCHFTRCQIDIYTAFKNNIDDSTIDENYFLGSIIIIPKGNEFDVVDGQQRLTTLTILFCVVRDLFSNVQSIKLIKNSIIDFVEEKQRLKLRTDIQMQNEFENSIINKISWPEKFVKKDKKKYKYMNTAIMLKEKIEPLQESELDSFIQYLFNKVRMITISCSNDSFAIKLFQVLNTRGMDLSPSDLIKSFLLSKLDADNHDQFMATWREIEALINNSNESITDLFGYYEYYLLASNPKRSIYDELSVVFDNKIKNDKQTPNTIIFDFKKFVEKYIEIITSKNRIIFSLFYLRHHVYWKSILTTAKHINFPDFNKLTKLLRRFYYLYWIAGFTTAKIKQTSFNIIEWIKEGKDYNIIKNEIRNKIRNDKVLSRIRENLQGDVYGDSWTKPLLIMIEYHQVDESNITNYLNIDRNIQIEHILPQKNRDHSYWVNLYSDEESDSILHTIGNLTLLSGTKNIQASYNSFPKKLSIYDGKGIDGMTSFRITQQIRDAYKKWDEDEFINRYNWILKQVSTILNINLDSINKTKLSEFVEVE
jgi:uncharacterized protein with ParB-like and HNH nuclease domain